MRDAGIYIHWPFCAKKCPYCDFNTHVHDTIDQPRWKKAYLRALDHYAAMLPDVKVASVFFGGGTPSLMPPDTVTAIIEKIKTLWPCDDDIEITLEANPTSVEAAKFKAFRGAGVNRISLGVQSLREEDLKFLGRAHNAAEARAAIEVARDHFERFSFDLIYARPGQSLEAWRAELGAACDLANGHLSLYQLTIERSTPFYMEHAKGRFMMPDENLAADFYNLTQEITEARGLPAYEVSNHAAAGQESRHNLIYWRYGEYIGIGPGAHGRIIQAGKKYAVRDHAAPDVWLGRVEGTGHGAHPHGSLSPRDLFLEALMMGLRVREGVALDHLAERSGLKPDDVFDAARIKTAQAEGWLEAEQGLLKPTREGWLRLNALVPFLLKQ